MSDQPPPTPPGWHDDPNDATLLRYWDGSQWTDDRSPKPPPPSAGDTTHHRPDSMWGGKPAPVPTAVALDGWVDVKLSTVPNVVIDSTKGNWYKVYASGYTGDLSVSGRGDAPIMNCARGTYSAELAMGFKTVRKTPVWAIVLGIIGLLFFLLGALLFLVKENRQEETRILTVTLADGRSFSGPYVDAASYA